ncbi:MAG: 3-deoxy-D-manno-octulosonic acid kinase [Pseudomonadota bacterium]
MRLAALQQGNSLILHDADSLCDEASTHQPHPALFRADYWRERELIVGEAPGRGNSLFLQATDSEQWVLRPYRRGGLIAKLSEKNYLWIGAERTRAFRELRLTASLYDQGLPVPRPVACCVTRNGLTYEAGLLTVRVPAARAFASVLEEGGAHKALLMSIGAMVKRFHQAGLDHVDLNARNILIDAHETPWLIDLDRCRLRQSGRWQKTNLDRLARSIRKFSPATAFSPISQGYHSAN